MHHAAQVCTNKNCVIIHLLQSRCAVTSVVFQSMSTALPNIAMRCNGKLCVVRPDAHSLGRQQTLQLSSTCWRDSTYRRLTFGILDPRFEVTVTCQRVVTDGASCKCVTGHRGGPWILKLFAYCGYRGGGRCKLRAADKVIRWCSVQCERAMCPPTLSPRVRCRSKSCAHTHQPETEP